MSHSTKDKEYKVIIIGEMAVGKTSLMHRYANGIVLNSPEATIGIEHVVKNVNIKGERIKVHLCDTGGLERFRTVVAPYYRRADGVVMVYDVTRKDTLNELQFWQKECEYYDLEDIPKIIVGNKCDLPKQVSTEEGQRFSRNINHPNGIPFFETNHADSAIEGIFESLLQRMYDKRKRENNESNSNSDSFNVGPVDTREGQNINCCMAYINNLHVHIFPDFRFSWR